MTYFPSFESFKSKYDAGEAQVLYARRIADLDTPVSIFLKLGVGRKNSCILESVTGGEFRGRYSAIALKPDLIWRCEGQKAELNRAALYDDHGFIAEADDPLTSLRNLISETRIEMPHELPPISCGLFGYLGYDMIRLVEHLPHINPDPIGMSDAIFMRPTVVVVLDGVKDEAIIVTPIWPEKGKSAQAAYAQAAERLNEVLVTLDRAAPQITVTTEDEVAPPEAVSNTSKERYFEIVEAAKNYIRAGDIFQVVPSQRWTQDFNLPNIAFYRALRQTNPSPYMFHFDFGDASVTGASPEILVQVAGETVTIRPIAGTRPRGKTHEEDKELELDLLADKKELAEHLMLLDLGRNDVGRVAEIGSVTPTEQFIIEHYSHVMHIVSNVEGKLAPDQDALSALLAGLPAGTVSGAPKVRAMEIIDELESEKRGVYGGGVGYFSANGDMDICIALRTAVIKNEKLYIQAGGGVVYDSDPEAEYQETVHKSNALRTAARSAYKYVTKKGN